MVSCSRACHFYQFLAPSALMLHGDVIGPSLHTHFRYDGIEYVNYPFMYQYLHKNEGTKLPAQCHTVTYLPCDVGFRFPCNWRTKCRTACHPTCTHKYIRRGQQRWASVEHDVLAMLTYLYVLFGRNCVLSQTTLVKTAKRPARMALTSV